MTDHSGNLKPIMKNVIFIIYIYFSLHLSDPKPNPSHQLIRIPDNSNFQSLEPFQHFPWIVLYLNVFP